MTAGERYRIACHAERRAWNEWKGAAGISKAARYAEYEAAVGTKNDAFYALTHSAPLEAESDLEEMYRRTR